MRPAPALSLLASALALCTTAAWADAPMTTEDADVLAVGSCEWEGAANRSKAGGLSANSVGTKVGCGWIPGTQLAISAARTRAEGATATGFGLSGETALVARPPGGFGMTLAYGFTWVKAPGDQLRYAATSLNLTATQGLDKVTLHGNVGVVRDRGEGGTTQTWALGAEYALSDSVSALAETYGSEGSKPLMGVGLRWQASTDWTLGLMASQSRDTPKVRDVLLSAKLAF